MSQPVSPGPTILVAEDNLEQRSLYVAILQGAGYHVLEASDGAEAVEIAQRELPKLVMMDVTMPGTSGWNALRILRFTPETQDIPIVVVTGLAGTMDRDASIAAGCDEYLAKPVSPLRLLEVVRKYVRP